MQSKKRIFSVRWKLPIFLVLTLSILSCDDAESREQLAALHKLAADTPIFVDFKEVRSYDSNKPNHARFSKCYNSSANYNEVKSFYSETLTARGWSLPEETTVYGSFGFEEKKDSRDLIFRKAKYSIAIAYGPKDSSGCNYAISYIWEE